MPRSTTKLAEYRQGDLVKLDVMVNREPVDAFSVILHRDNAYRHGAALVRKLKELIPKAAVRGGPPGRDRGTGHCSADRQGRTQERHGQVLRGGHH